MSPELARDRRLTVYCGWAAPCSSCRSYSAWS